MTIRAYVPAVALAAATMLAACGGGGGGNTARAPGAAPPATKTSFDRSQATRPYGSGLSLARFASNEPTNTDATGRAAVVGGVNQSRMLRYVQQRGGCTRQSCYPASLSGRHGRAEIGHLRLRDGVSANELLRYLRADANFRGGVVRRWGRTPPIVRMIQGSTDRGRFETLNAVRLVNSALPTNWQLRFDDTPAAHDGRLTPGVIEVAFAPRKQWPSTSSATARGVAYVQTTGGQITAAAAVVDPTRVNGERERVSILLHELLHTLGRGHVSPTAFPDTIMHASVDHGVSEWLILNYLDEAALHAVYSRLTPGTPVGDLNYRILGPWNDVSTHVWGRIGHIPGRYPASSGFA